MAKPKQDADTQPGFEADLETLEHIVEALEDGNLSLEDSLKRFEEGVTLARRCEKALTEAEKKIEMLVKKADGTLEAVPFDEETPPEEAAVSPRPAPAKSSARSAPRVEAPPEPHAGYEEDELPF